MTASTRSMLTVAAALLVASCGSEAPGTGPGAGSPTTAPTAASDPPSTGPAIQPLALPDRRPSDAAADLAGAAVTAFSHDVFAGAAADVSPDANVVVSPLSIAIALGMLEPGASGDGRAQLRQLLRLGDDDAAAARWHASVSALEQSLEARVAELPNPDVAEGQVPGEFTAQIANAAFIQPGYPFLPAYLDAVGTTYGAVIEQLDFAANQAAAAEHINAFIADATDDHITDLVPPGAITPDTVLALVNALLLRASWLTQFDAEATADGAFTRADGSTVSVPLMHGGSDRSGKGDGWVAASKQLVAGITVDVVLPDAGRFDEIAARLPEVFADYDLATAPGGELVVPRFETRVNTSLTRVLPAIGLSAPFVEGNLMGIAGDPTTVVSDVLHETWISVDESGIEAAAATVVLVIATSAPIEEPVPVVLDRPFLFRIVDTDSGATLFIGRIMDPTA